MQQREYDRFASVVGATMDVYGKERSAAALALWWKVLERFSLADVESALARHMHASRFAPTPADVVGLIADRDGRPGADEAWAMIPRTEAESVIWTEEMARAYGVAAPLLSSGDAIAARKAFIQAYEGEVAKARFAGTPVKVTPSWGWDEKGRDAAMSAAIERGLVTQERAVKLLPTYQTAQAEPLQLPDGAVKALKLVNAG